MENTDTCAWYAEPCTYTGAGQQSNCCSGFVCSNGGGVCGSQPCCVEAAPSVHAVRPRAPASPYGSGLSVTRTQVRVPSAPARRIVSTQTHVCTTVTYDDGSQAMNCRPTGSY